MKWMSIAPLATATGSFRRGEKHTREFSEKLETQFHFLFRSGTVYLIAFRSDLSIKAMRFCQSLPFLAGFLLISSASLNMVSGFVPTTKQIDGIRVGMIQPSSTVLTNSKSSLRMIPADLSTATALSYSIVEASTATSSVAMHSNMLLAETEAWVQPLSLVLGPFLNFLSFAMLCRVVASWYPTTNLNELPWAIIAWPTEPLLRIVKGSIPPAFGVDITPVFWLAIFTFINEILLGQQGLLTMKMKYGI